MVQHGQDRDCEWQICDSDTRSPVSNGCGMDPGGEPAGSALLNPTQLPDGRQEFQGVVYSRYACGYMCRSPRYLHLEVYRANFGPVPDGMVVHHKDHCSTNNSADNLVLLTRAEHAAAHHKQRKQSQSQVEGRIRGFKRFVATERGRQWRAKHTRSHVNGKLNSRTAVATCERCRKDFLSTPAAVRRAKRCPGCKVAANREYMRNKRALLRIGGGVVHGG